MKNLVQYAVTGTQTLYKSGNPTFFEEIYVV